MIIERNIAPYVVFAEDPILNALQKISANGQRIIFLVNESGILRGSLSDGDFRRWLIANPTASLETSALDAANTNPQTAPADADPETLRAYFAKGINHVPLTDERGHLVALAMDEQDVLRIGKHTISEDSPSFIIAEIGNNHQGSVDFAKELVDLAVESGADAVKFQLRDMDALYRQRGAATAGEDLGVQYTLDLLSRFSLTVDQMYEVFDHVKQHDMDIMCTPWDAPSVQALVDYGIQGMKIASADLTNHELLRDVASRGLPMLVSTGMSRE